MEVDEQNTLETVPARTPMEKAIDKAFAYHPFRLPSVEVLGDWVAGPTFIVKGEYSCPVDGEPHSIWKPDGLLGLKVDGILSGAKAELEWVRIASKGHPKNAITKTDKYGAERPTTPTTCTCRAIFNAHDEPVGELGFPLLSLAKRAGALHYKFDPAGVLYGFNKLKELVVVLAVKGFDRCLPKTHGTS